MKRYLLLLLTIVNYSIYCQTSEKMSPDGDSYYDPEISNPYSLVTYQKQNGEIWIAHLDTKSGLFENPYGNDELVGVDAAPLLQTFNGPEFGYDTSGWRIVYTKNVDGLNQIWQIQEIDSNYVSSLVAAGQLPRQSALASKNFNASSTRIVYTIEGFNGLMAWKDLSDVNTEILIDSVDRGIRWIDQTNKLTYIKQSGADKGEIAIYDTDTQTEEIISTGGRSKAMSYGWLAPEFDNQLMVACLADNDQTVIVYKKTNDVWSIFLEFQAPEESSYTFFGSPEAFTASGRSYISCVIKEFSNAYSKSEVWVFSLGDAIGQDVKIQLMATDEMGDMIRSDPETYIGDNEVFVYYNLVNDENVFELYRSRTHLETLNGDHITYHMILPGLTDSAITGNNDHHYVIEDISAEKLNKLMLFFPGTNARPYDYLKFSRTSAQLGYHAISLCYENDLSINYGACGSSSDVTCHGRARQEIWTGEDTHNIIDVSPANSILNRVKKLLSYLSDHYPEQNWDQYMEGQEILWNKIVVAGHSQGGGHAAYASKLFEVDRVVMMAATDWVQNQTAEWIRTPGPTSEDRYFGFIHEDDLPISNFIMATWQDYGILNYGDPVIVENVEPPYNEVHGLFSNKNVPDEEIRPHNFIIVDFLTPNDENYQGYAYSDTWNYLLNSDVLLDIVEDVETSPLEIFPNPAHSLIHINIADKFQIYDIYGNQVIETTGLADRIDIRFLSPGLYVITSGKQKGKFIKF